MNFRLSNEKVTLGDFLILALFIFCTIFMLFSKINTTEKDLADIYIDIGVVGILISIISISWKGVSGGIDFDTPTGDYTYSKWFVIGPTLFGFVMLISMVNAGITQSVYNIPIFQLIQPDNLYQAAMSLVAGFLEENLFSIGIFGLVSSILFYFTKRHEIAYSLGMIISMIFFVGFHWNVYGYNFQALMFVAGLSAIAIGWIIWTKNPLAGLFIHGINNFSIIYVKSGGTLSTLIPYIIAIIIFIAIFIYLYRKVRRKKS